MTVQKHDVVAAIGGVVGAVIALLPTFQALPVHATSSEVIGALASGAAIILAALVQHGVVSAKQSAKVSRVINEAAPEVEAAVSQIPVAQKLASDASSAVSSLEGRVAKLEQTPVAQDVLSALKELVDKSQPAAAPAS